MSHADGNGAGAVDVEMEVDDAGGVAAGIL